MSTVGPTLQRPVDNTHSPISDAETAAMPGFAMSGVRTLDARTSPTALSTAADSSSIPKE